MEFGFNPTHRQHGFDLVRYRPNWALRNRYHTGYGRCATRLPNWSVRDDPNYERGSRQTMMHIVNESPRLQGSLTDLLGLYAAESDAIDWLRMISMR